MEALLLLCLSFFGQAQGGAGTAYSIASAFSVDGLGNGQGYWNIGSCSSSVSVSSVHVSVICNGVTVAEYSGLSGSMSFNTNSEQNTVQIQFSISMSDGSSYSYSYSSSGIMGSSFGNSTSVNCNTQEGGGGGDTGGGTGGGDTGGGTGGGDTGGGTGGGDTGGGTGGGGDSGGSNCCNCTCECNVDLSPISSAISSLISAINAMSSKLDSVIQLLQQIANALNASGSVSIPSFSPPSFQFPEFNYDFSKFLRLKQKAISAFQVQISRPSDSFPELSSPLSLNLFHQQLQNPLSVSMSLLATGVDNSVPAGNWFRRFSGWAVYAFALIGFIFWLRGRFSG